MGERNKVIGISFNMTLFNSFQTSATKKRLKAELLQLKLKNMQEERRLKEEHLEIRQSIKYASSDIKNYNSTIEEQTNKAIMKNRLFKVKEVTAIDKLEDKIEILYTKLQKSSKIIEQDFKFKELEILNSNQKGIYE
jgi:hypothetical protein